MIEKFARKCICLIIEIVKKFLEFRIKMRYLDFERQEIEEGFYIPIKKGNEILFYIEKSRKIPGHWAEKFDWIIYSSGLLSAGLTSKKAKKLFRIYNIETYLNSLEKQIAFGHSILERLPQTSPKCTEEEIEAFHYHDS